MLSETCWIVLYLLFVVVLQSLSRFGSNRSRLALCSSQITANFSRLATNFLKNFADGASAYTTPSPYLILLLSIFASLLGDGTCVTQRCIILKQVLSSKANSSVKKMSLNIGFLCEEFMK